MIDSPHSSILSSYTQPIPASSPPLGSSSPSYRMLLLGPPCTPSFSCYRWRRWSQSWSSTGRTWRWSHHCRRGGDPVSSSLLIFVCIPRLSSVLGISKKVAYGD
jgi:hypothetical protein